ncbi:hypothetical protein EH197_23105 [Enterococcus avium]|uniref:Uncharacterized protein n=2 Tax=Enterococcus TaxID=1350 RepID=A0A437UK76_ENTAV|nr:hypothetical protein EH197_23105 [Enterococcus avium]RVU93975.1 hypothetical protein EK398_03360 [Enterococcus avium]
MRYQTHNEQILTYRQTFSLKPETLEKRVMEYYQETQNSSLTIKYILALRVRFKLGAQEFSHILEDLVRYLFMNTKATRTMKRFFYYFKDYFMEAEWKRLTLRIFPLRNFGKKILSVVRSLIPSGRPEETTKS